jgi:hypothetical protein
VSSNTGRAECGYIDRLLGVRVGSDTDVEALVKARKQALACR